MDKQEHFSIITNNFHKEYKALNEILGEIYFNGRTLPDQKEKAKQGYCIATELLKEIQRLQFSPANNCR